MQWLNQFNSDRRWAYVALAVILLFTAALQLYKLGDWSFWIDEAFTVRDIQDGSSLSVTRQLIIVTTQTLGRMDEWAYRLAPALLGIISIPVLFYAIRSLGKSNIFALLCCALIAVSYWHIDLSQNARYYSAIILFSALSLISVYLALQRNRIQYYILALVFFVLAFLERGYALFLVPTVFVFIVIAKLLNFGILANMSNARFFRILILLGLAGGGLYAALEAFNWISGRGFFLIDLYTVFLSQKPDYPPQWVLSLLVYNMGGPVFLLAAWGGAISVFYRRNAANLLVLTGALVPTLTLMTLAVLVKIWPHYTLITLPFFFILAVIGLRDLYVERRIVPAAAIALLSMAVFLRDDYFEDLFYIWPQVRTPLLVALAVLALLVLATALWAGRQRATILTILILGLITFDFSAVNVLYYGPQHGYRAQWREAMDLILMNRQAGEPIYITSFTHEALAAFYLNTEILSLDDFERKAGSLDFDSWFAAEPVFWIIEETEVDMDWGGDFMAWAQGHCDLRVQLDDRFTASARRLRVYYCNQPNPLTGN